jgi:hypothetical protein
MVNLEDVAQEVIEVSLGVKSGEKVWIHGWDRTVELMSHLACECRKHAFSVRSANQRDMRFHLNRESKWLSTIPRDSFL